MAPALPSGTPPGDAPHDAAPRPKLARRPASFARTTATVMPIHDEPLAPPAATNPKTHLTPINAWQEDARFGVAMLIIIVLVNAALVYGLPLLPATNSDNSPSQVAGKAPTMPSAMSTRNEGVTMYSQPEQERRTIYLLDLRNAASEQNALSVSPNDIPPPTARALDPDREQ
ncbi:MAG: hypothetical protein WC216_02670 [Gallionella sp.]|jgi:hypothetical protein